MTIFFFLTETLLYIGKIDYLFKKKLNKNMLLCSAFGV